MIAWLNPLALVGLLAVLGPILIHLLRQPRAVRVLFPSLRFVQPSRTVAARMRRIADPWLLLVRMAIVASAALALAQPVFLTAGRLDAWNSRTARAIVIDSSRGMQQAAAAASGRARAEADGAFASALFEASDLREATARASAWLAAAPPARRELVLISDFRLGALTTEVAADVPAGFGIRAVQVGEPEPERRLAGLARFGTGARQDVRLTDDATEVAWTDGTTSAAGVRFMPESGTDRLVRAVAAAGAPDGSAHEPIVLLFTGADIPQAAPIQAGWMLDTVTRMSMDAELLRAAAGADPAFDPAAPWFALAPGTDGRARVRAAATGGELIVQVAATPADYLAAAALRSALHARHGSMTAALEAQEIVRMPAEDIAALQRDADEVGRDAASRLERSDARWLWLTALLLLSVESWMRRTAAAGRVEAAHAA